MIFTLTFPSGKIPTVTSQEKGVAVQHGRPHFYDTPALKRAKEEILAAIFEVPRTKFIGAVRLDMTFVFFRKGAKKNLAWKVTKPDTDNLIKLFKDCFTTAGFWDDDAQVTYEITKKYVTGKKQNEIVIVEITSLEYAEEEM